MAERTRSWLAVVAMLQHNDVQAARTVRRWQVGITVTRVVLYVLTAGAIVWAIIKLRDAWHSGRWDDFWDVVRNYPLFLFAAPLSSVVTLYESLYDTSRTLREAALRGDDHEAPLAQKQPESDGGGTVLLGETRYGPLNPPKDGRGAGARALSIMALCTCFVVGIITAILVVTEAGTPLVLIAGSAAVPFLLLAIWLFVLSARQQRRIIVMADDMGIAWKVAGWRARIKRIAWHDAQAFVVMHSPQSGKRAQDIVWVLIGPDATLLWTDPHEEASREDTPHTRFAALVAARTRLPLRDLSALAEKVAHGLDAKAEEIAHPIAALVDASEEAEAHRADHDIATRHAAPEAHVRPGCSSVRVGCLVQIVLTLTILLLYPVGWGLQQYQSHYYGGLLTQIRASKPLYHDDMTYDNGDWPLCAPTVDNPDRCGYGGQSYHLTSASGRFVSAWTGPVYGSVVVEGTASQIGAVEYDGVGLILRTLDDRQDMVVFFIHPTEGTWSLAHYHNVGGSSDDNWTAFENGSSPAIRTAQGATNDLLVIMAGDRYICYINGKLVLSYDDGKQVIPHTGHVGLYVNDGATEGVFTNFTVYPAPPPSIWSALYGSA